MRTFDHFNPGFGAVCPVCKTAADAETVLVPIPGTEDERICEARQVHKRYLMPFVFSQLRPSTYPVITVPNSVRIESGIAPSHALNPVVRSSAAPGLNTVKTPIGMAASSRI